MIPRRMPEAYGKYVVIKNYSNSNHEGNMANRRLWSGIIICVNNVSVIWHIKRQNTVEASIFGLELVALRISTDIIEALW